MCRGVPQESIEGSGLPHISLLHQHLKPEHHHEEHGPPASGHERSAKIMAPRDRGVNILISRGRNPVVRQAAQVARFAPLGLAIVAALHESELLQSAGTCTTPSSPGSHVIDVQPSCVQVAADYSFPPTSRQILRPISSSLRPMVQKPSHIQRLIHDEPVIELKIVGDRKDGTATKRSIFSITFSPLEYADCMSRDSLCSPDNYFLRVCFFCQRQLDVDKDIYMYRGDRAFCSGECRYQHIVAEERTELNLQRVKPLAYQRPGAVLPQPVKACRSIAVLS